MDSRARLAARVARDRAVPRDGGADGRARARGGGPQRRPHGDRRAGFSDAATRARCRAARHRRGRHLLHVGAWPAGAARGDRAPLRRPLRRRRRARARHRHRRVVGGAAARDGAASSIATSGSCSPIPAIPCNRHFVRVLEGEPVGIPVGPETRYQLTADLIERNWTRDTRGALDRHAVQSDRHDGRRATRCARIARDGRAPRRPADRRRDLPGTDLRRARRAARSSSPTTHSSSRASRSTST